MLTSGWSGRAAPVMMALGAQKKMMMKKGKYDGYKDADEVLHVVYDLEPGITDALIPDPGIQR
jgi:hypothetical protein